MSENRSRGECLLERVESIMIREVKFSWNVLLDKICQWNNNIQVVEDEPVIEISKTQRGLNVLNFLELWPVLNNLHFVIGHSNAKRRKNVFQIFYWLGVEFVFFCFGIKASLVEILEYFLDIPVIFGHVIWVDKYIIQIDYNIDIQKVGENIIYKLLKGCKSIGKIKEYYRPLKWSIMCLKSNFPFITCSDVNQIVSMVKIYFWIDLSFARWV